MPEQRQTVITKREKFVVASTEKNTYGDLLVKSTDGKDYKIGNKRARLFDVFQEGAEVQVGYAEYMQKEYIATAEQTGVHKDIVVKTEEVVKTVEKLMPHKTETSKYKADPDKIESIERQSSLKSAVEWCSVKVQAGVDIKTDEVIKVAEKFLEYIENLKK